MTDENQAIDWAEIERDYRTGTMSLRDLGRWYSISEGAIRKRAKKGGWVRENAATGTQSKARTEDAPEREKIYVGTVLTPENASPEAIVGRGRNLVLRMMDELEATTSHQGELECLIEMAVDGADASKQREALRQAVSLKQRSDIVKALATAAKTLAESGAPQGIKAARQAAAEDVASGRRGPSKFAPPPAPRLVVSNPK